MAKRHAQWAMLLQRSQVVGQVVLLQGVRLEAVGRPVKVVVADAADEAFGLQEVQSTVSPIGEMNLICGCGCVSIQSVRAWKDAICGC